MLDIVDSEAPLLTCSHSVLVLVSTCWGHHAPPPASPRSLASRGATEAE